MSAAEAIARLGYKVPIIVFVVAMTFGSINSHDYDISYKIRHGYLLVNAAQDMYMPFDLETYILFGQVIIMLLVVAAGLVVAVAIARRKTARPWRRAGWI